MLRFLEVSADSWSYHTAYAKAVELGLTPSEALADSTITRGDMAVLMYRALGSPLGTATTVNSAPASTGTVALPTDGSQYVPKTGDVIRCNDGTDYTITTSAVMMPICSLPGRWAHCPNRFVTGL